MMWPGAGNPLVEKARRGERVTLLDKINAEQDPDELDLMVKAVMARGQQLSTDEYRAWLNRSSALRGGRAK